FAVDRPGGARHEYAPADERFAFVLVEDHPATREQVLGRQVVQHAGRPALLEVDERDRQGLDLDVQSRAAVDDLADDLVRVAGNRYGDVADAVAVDRSE